MSAKRDKNRRTLQRIIDLQNVMCWWCGNEIMIGAPEREQRATRDHLIPLGQGGLNRAWNIVAACELCNNTRDVNVWPVHDKIKDTRRYELLWATPEEIWRELHPNTPQHPELTKNADLIHVVPVWILVPEGAH